MVAYLFWTAVSFFSGSVMYSYLIPKLFYGKDITKISKDGNPGCGNVFTCIGIPCGVLCLLLELAKGAVPRARFFAHAQKSRRQGNRRHLRHIYRTLPALDTSVSACGSVCILLYRAADYAAQSQGHDDLRGNARQLGVFGEKNVAYSRRGHDNRSRHIPPHRRLHPQGKAMLRTLCFFVQTSRTRTGTAGNIPHRQSLTLCFKDGFIVWARWKTSVKNWAS